jgi:arginine/lysine/ornithine decarboxylase
MPEIDRERGLVGGLLPETLRRAFERYPDAKAVFAVSPTYHGVMSDTKALAEIAHEYGAVLIADEAHGNHMYFSDRLPNGALELGADIVCQSTHKMSGSLTQASMLHLGADAGGRVDFDRMQANLSMMQTTSPSYLLLASLDMARSFIATRGEEILGAALNALEAAREEIRGIDGIEVLGSGGAIGAGYEPTRLVFSARALGMDGYTLFRTLRERYNIECEFADPLWCVCVAGLGTTSAHTRALADALADLAKRAREGGHGVCGDVAPDASVSPQSLPPLRMSPREAWFSGKETVPFEKALGRVSAEMVVPYPPGIPVLNPGELITDEVMAFLAAQRSKRRHIHAAAGDGLCTLVVVKKSVRV